MLGTIEIQPEDLRSRPGTLDSPPQTQIFTLADLNPGGLAKCATPGRFAGSQNCFPVGGLTVQRTLDPTPLRSGGASSRQAPALIIQWAFYGEPSTLKHMGIDHCSFHILVTEEFLDGADVVPIFKEVSRETMAKGMWRDGFVYSSKFGGMFDSFLKV